MSMIVSIPEVDCGIPGGVSFDGSRFHKESDPGSWWVRHQQFEQRSLQDLMPIFGDECPHVVHPSVREAYKSLTNGDVPWIKAIGKDRFLKAVKGVHMSATNWISRPEVQGYIETILLEREVLATLSPAKVDIREFEKRRTSPSVDSFEPDSLGYTRKVRYSHATSTGRLKIVDGPKILTVSKQDRRVISSRFSDGRILQVDFVSLEPRVALYSVGQDPGREDVYEWIAKSVGAGLTRSKVKVPTLSILYGQSARNDDPVSSSLRERIGTLFRVSDLRERVSGESFKNAYGRPLDKVEDRLVISHFTQSTAVDVALLGFRNLIRDLGGHVGNGIIPLFVLHDALILDVSPELYGMLKRRIDEGVDVSPLGHFPLSLGPIWDE